MSKTSLQKTTLPLLRSAYDGLSDAVSDQTGTSFLRPEGLTEVEWANHPNYSRTDQSQSDQADINTIVNQFLGGADGPNTDWLHNQGSDLTGFVGDYHALQNQMIAANDAFLALPAHLRARFDNEPGNLLQFLADDQNRKEAEALGLVPPQQESSSSSPKELVDDDSSARVRELKISSKKGGKSDSDEGA